MGVEVRAQQAAMAPQVSAYVPCCNAEAWIGRVLEGVLSQTVKLAEVIVVDDGSRDRSAEIASRYPVRVIRHEKNRGLAAARNTAMQAVQSELVAAVDSDVVPERDWLERLAPHFSGGKVALGGGKLVESVDRTLADRWRAVHLQQHWGDTPVVNPAFVFGANTVARRSAVLEAGGYDERLRTNGEDSDLSRRLRERGCDTFYEPAAVCRHLREDTVESALTTFWRYRRDFYTAMTPAKVWRQFRYQHIGSARCVLKEDLRAGRYEFLGMDALLVATSCWNDVKVWRAQAAERGETRGAAPSREVTS